MIQQAKDLGFIGPAYQAPMLLQDTETCINFYCEIAESDKAKMPIALLGAPGLNPVLSTQVGQVRGLWALPGGQQAIMVVSSVVYLVSITAQATQSSIPVYGAIQIGSLLTNTGPVCIRDNGVAFNGAGGYVVIVDGQYGYYYNIAGTSRVITFTASVTNGQSTISAGYIPSGLVVTTNAVVTDSSGFIPAGTKFTGADFNSVVLNMSAAATGTNASDIVTITIPAFGQITDPAFLPASRIAFIEGWLIFNQVGTRTFFTNAAVAYTLLFAGSFYALKDSSTDNLVTLYENNRELWLIGERTSEVWYDSGGANFAFSRIPAIGPQMGCSAQNSITRLGPNLVWLAKNEQGENIVVMQAQYNWERISNHGVEHAISSYPVVSDAIGYAYEEEGHLFYMLTFPTADVTWCYDLKTQMWHQRLSLDGNGVFHRHRSNCFMNLGDVRLVGDYQSGQLHQMSRQFYTDAGGTLKAQRRTGHIWEASNRKRVFHGWIQVEFTPGVGLQNGQGQNPQAMLRWSNDGGFTWSNEHWTTIGAAGQTRNRAIWRRLGRARDRVYELNITDPVARDIIGATVFFEPEEEADALP